jgi:hypothetical protein
MRFQGILRVAVLLIASASASFAQQSEAPAPNRLVSVTTRNVYHGVDAESAAVNKATSQADLLTKVAAVCNSYLARNFPERRRGAGSGDQSC